MRPRAKLTEKNMPMAGNGLVPYESIHIWKRGNNFKGAGFFYILGLADFYKETFLSGKESPKFTTKDQLQTGVRESRDKYVDCVL
jgi:hypothetical protein